MWSSMLTYDIELNLLFWGGDGEKFEAYNFREGSPHHTSPIISSPETISWPRPAHLILVIEMKSSLGA